MVRTHRCSTTVALIVCLVGTTFSGPLLASDSIAGISSNPAIAGSHTASDTAGVKEAAAATPTPSDQSFPASSSPFVLGDRALAANALLTENRPLGAIATTDLWASPFALASSDAMFAQRGYRGRGGRSGRQAAAAFFAAGALVTITGGAILVYANRPDCKFYGGQGCGYGTRVIGGAILSAGLVGMLAGAVAWK